VAGQAFFFSVFHVVNYDGMSHKCPPGGVYIPISSSLVQLGGVLERAGWLLLSLVSSFGRVPERVVFSFPSFFLFSFLILTFGTPAELNTLSWDLNRVTSSADVTRPGIFSVIVARPH